MVFAIKAIMLGAALAMGKLASAVRTSNKIAQEASVNASAGTRIGCPYKAVALKGVAELSTAPVLAAVEAGRQSVLLADSNPELAARLGAACDSFVRFDQTTFRPFISKEVKDLFNAMRAKTNAQAEKEPELLEELIMVFKSRFDAAGTRGDEEMTKIYRPLIALHEHAKQAIAARSEPHVIPAAA